jgi:hypothetical protein
MKNFLFGLVFTFGLCACTSTNGIPDIYGTPLPTTRIETSSPNVILPIEPSARIETLLPTIGIATPTFEEIPQALPTPYIALLYRLQPGLPKVIPNFAHPDSGCNWMGVGGQVFDIDGNPVENVIIKLTGTLDNNVIEMIALSGGAIYLGPGGYEFKLADQPVKSRETLWLILFDERGKEISEPITFSTSEMCDQNFLLINFIQMLVVKNGSCFFLPFVNTGELR